MKGETKIKEKFETTDGRTFDSRSDAKDRQLAIDTVENHLSNFSSDSFTTANGNDETKAFLIDWELHKIKGSPRQAVPTKATAAKAS